MITLAVSADTYIGAINIGADAENKQKYFIYIRAVNMTNTDRNKPSIRVIKRFLLLSIRDTDTCPASM